MRKICLLLIAVLLIVCSACSNSPSTNTVNNPTASTKSDVGLTRDKAQTIAEAWLAKNKFPFETSISPNPIKYAEGTTYYEEEGTKYHSFNVFEKGEGGFVNILVEISTSKLYARENLNEVQPLDEWRKNYDQRRAASEKEVDAYIAQVKQQEKERTASLDSSLVGGRWLADNGKGFEFLSNGAAGTNYDLFFWNQNGYASKGKGKDELYWSARNGRLTLTGVHTITYTYSLAENIVLLSAPEVRGDRLILNGNNQFNRELGKGSGITGGMWNNPTNNVQMEFFSDGNGRRRWNHGVSGFSVPWINFKWSIEGNRLSLTYREEVGFDYVVEGSGLSIFTDKGRIRHTRVGGR